ncbi:MAG: AMP-binding protein, partial [Deltaproteobacteria bacterium]|nr:AMP-binding protein [Deltaproteobacteria bacterium]
EWLAFDVACFMYGLVSIPFYPSWKPSEISAILEQVDMKCLIAETPSLTSEISIINGRIVYLAASDDRLTSLDSFSPVDDLIIQKVDETDLVTIVFTSGTEGRPKGVPQTHKNHFTNLAQVSEVGLFEENDLVYLFLPLSHSFGRLCGYVGSVLGVPTLFPSLCGEGTRIDLRKVVSLIAVANPTIVPAVPKFFELIKKEIESRIKPVKRFLSFSNFLNKATHSVLGKFIIPRIFGKSIRYCISGGAKLMRETQLFFDSLGLLILEGYGLTETCVATHVNLPWARRLGSVGRPLPGIQHKIVDGEVLLKGENIFNGYWRSTEQPFTDDGWFKTGDSGWIDADNFLFIEGRKKEILVLSNGKNVPCLKLEHILESLVEAKHVVVFGDGADFVVAVLFVDDPNFLFPRMHSFLEQLNQNLNPYEKVKGVLLVKGDLTVDNGFLTPTLKLRRQLIYKVLESELMKLFEKPNQIVISNLSGHFFK